MTSVALDDVVSLDERRFSLGALPRERRKAAFAPTRRDFIRGTVGTGAAVSMGLLGLLPTAKPAAADTPPGGWLIWSGCTGLGSWVTDDDCNGCNQGSILCCCGGGYHLGPASGCNYAFRPDQCKSGGYDGWTWSTAQCCYIPSCLPGCYRGFKNRNWRCSDGYYRSSCTAAWGNSICRYLLSGGTSCGGCLC